MTSKLTTTDNDFNQKLDKLLSWESVSDDGVLNTVKTILKDVEENGDDALINYCNKFDNLGIDNINQIVIVNDRLKESFDKITKKQRDALQSAKERIEFFHQKQKRTSITENANIDGSSGFNFVEENGTMLGQKITPLSRIGLYVPGGKAAYPSSVLMNAIPAKVAGVKELIMVVPTPNGDVNDLVFAAAYICGVSKVFAVGGAQAVAALTYGTATIPAVNKIVGPGNIFVATAKKEVFGKVGIDMIAGPSEILIICDGKTNPDWIAMDLFSQAEHDEDAQSILLTDDEDFLNEVEKSIKKLLPTMERKAIIEVALKERGALILTKNIDEAVAISNKIAPEHLELSVENPQEMLKDIENAGAIFMGRNTCESLGDYCAGPNHVLPTSGTAKFSSPLGVDDFVKKSSLIMVSKKGASELGEIAGILADGEGLEAHAVVIISNSSSCSTCVNCSK
jgi:histidinol dehydrogenase